MARYEWAIMEVLAVVVLLWEFRRISRDVKRDRAAKQKREQQAGPE